MNRVTGRASLQTEPHAFEPLEGRLLLAATLIRDIIDESNGGSARLYPDPGGDGAYLFTSTTEVGRVYRTDGTKQGTVRLRNVPHNVTPVNVNGKLIYFHNKALWKASDNPGKAPVKLRNFDTFNFNLTETGDEAFFIVRREVDTATGTNVTDYLWTTDGTKAGTRRVETPDGKPLILPYHTLAEFDDRLYLAARTNTPGSEGLWKTDGTPESTKLVFHHDDPNETGLIWSLVAAGDRLYFPYEGALWGTDGTTKGTVKLADDPLGIFPAVDRAYFIPRGNGNEQQDELWTTDGTAAGTQHVTDLRGQYDHSHWQSAFVNGRFFFSEGRGSRSDLRVTDGTTKGTRLLADAGDEIPDSGGNPIGSLIADDDQLYFSRWTPESGRELWTTTGTPKSTRRVKEIGPGAENGFIGRVGVLDDTLFFLAKLDGAIDLWTTNGTSGGTRRFIKLRQPTVGTAFDHITPLDNGRFVFAADHPQTAAFFDGQAGQLWGSDATAAGTRLLADVGGRITEIEPAGDRAFVNVSYTRSDGSTLWVTDGTPAGTHRIFQRDEDWIGDVAVLDGVAYFSHGGKLWTSDGTSDGTRLLKDTATAALSALTQFGDRLYFTDYKTGPDFSISDLWVTDGTADGTRILRSEVPHIARDSRHDLLDATAFAADDKLFMFTFAGDGDDGRELWATDGTESGTRHLASFPEPSLNSITGAAVLDGNLLFAIRDDEDRTYLWSSDGTANGTVRLRKITSAGAFALQFTVVDNALYFIGQSKSRGYELWRSDGTAAGTKPFLDINPGTASAWPGNFSLTHLIAVDDLLVFNADDGVHGGEIWVTDGTRAGTRRVTDIAANDEWSAPSEFTIFGDHLIFTADDGTRGRELWQMPLSDLR